MWDTSHRPLVFADVLGQKGTVQLLKARLKNGTALDTSYIFSGGSGQGKCVVGSTLVSTTLGLTPIQDLMGPNQIDPTTHKVLQESGIAQAAYTYRGGLRETIRVRTYHGFELEGTPNHRILVLFEDGSIDWKRLDELDLGDQCCLLPRGLFGDGPDLSKWSYTRPDNDLASSNFTHPSVMTPELARLMGYLIGDRDCKSTKVTLACAESDIIQDQFGLLTRIFGSASITSDSRRDSLLSVRCLRGQPRDFLSYCGVSSVRAEDKSVPWSILQSPKNIICEFLRGYLESDGGLIAGSSGIEFSSKSKVLVQQVQLLLLQFGVFSRAFQGVIPEYGIYWRCQIYGNDVAIFEREIGFISIRKTRVLSHIVESRLVPNQNLLQLGFIFSPIASLELGEAEVYDLNVPDGERFAANGFINHNTTLARIYARAMLCENLDKNDPEPCNHCESCTSILHDSSVAFSEQDAASQGGIDQIRRIVDSLPFTVVGAAKRIYLFDECFTEDTLLRTPVGFRTILDIVESRYTGEVLSFDPSTNSVVWRKVVDWFEIKGLRDLIRLNLDNGVVLTVTPEQELFTSNRGWVKALDLDSDGDNIVGATLQPILKYELTTHDLGILQKVDMAKLVKKEYLPKGRVYDVTVSDTHSFFATSQLGSQTNLILAHNCHRMSKDAQDVLLKPLEERKMIGMFCTTEPEKVRGAIRSRCEEYGIRKVTREDILVRMRHILESEKVEYEDDGVLTVIDYAGGHVRDVVSRLEMIAQMGSITLDSVREHLNLSVVSTYYQILLNLTSDTKKALQLVDQACERVTAEEVASGVSEAAMNAFRLANGMSADFSNTDKTLAGEVYKLYGVDLIKIATHFLRSRFVTQVSLICDITTLAYSGAKGSFVSLQLAPLAPSLQVTPSTPTLAPVVAPRPSRVESIQSPPVEHQPESSEAQVVPSSSSEISIGNLGSDDPEARTIYDTHVIREGNPVKTRKPSQITFDITTSSDRDLLTHDIWRRGFTKLWNRGASG
jgi:DNA polymerase III gamma/tau subunit